MCSPASLCCVCLLCAEQVVYSGFVEIFYKKQLPVTDEINIMRAASMNQNSKITAQLADNLFAFKSKKINSLKVFYFLGITACWYFNN